MLWAPLQDPCLCWWQSESHPLIIPLLYPKTLTDARTFATIYQFSLEPRGQQELTCGQDGNTEACGRAVAGGWGWKVCVRPELFLQSLQGSYSKLSKC